MSSSLMAMTVFVALGGGPFGCPTCQSGGYDSGSYGSAITSGGYSAGGYSGGGYSGGGLHSTGMGLNPYSGSNGDTLLPWDSQEAWMHGYFQEISPYSGYHFYRPYNYKHVLSQADLAYRWGQPHGMPYSQQWWHKYQDRAAMHPGSQAQQLSQANAYQLELARLRAWRDFQAEQQRVSPTSAQQPVMQGQPVSTINPRSNLSTQPADTSIQAAIEQQHGTKAFVVPATPSPVISRSMQGPVIPEFNPSGTPSRR